MHCRLLLPGLLKHSALPIVDEAHSRDILPFETTWFFSALVARSPEFDNRGTPTLKEEGAIDASSVETPRREHHDR
jgi:hypothetical protein